MTERPTTIKDIAREANCSLSTVSKLLNGGTVREPQRSNILEIIKRLDYHPNMIAKGLRSKKSFTIGVLLPFFNSFFSMEIMKTIETELNKRGYSTIVCSSENKVEEEEKKIEFLLNNQVDGIIIIPVARDGSKINDIIQSRVPFVQVDGIMENVKGPGVILNNEDASYNATLDLLKEVKDVALIGSTDTYTSTLRAQGYRNAFKKMNKTVNETFFKNGHNSIDGGYIAMKELWKNEVKPSGLFVSNYEMTIGAIMAINELGINVSEELKIVGFDYVGLAKALNFNLTIIAQPLEEIGLKACEVLLSTIENKVVDQNVYILNARKVVLSKVN